MSTMPMLPPQERCPLRRCTWLVATLLVVMTAACGRPSASEFGALTSRVDSLARAVTVLGQQAGLTSRAGSVPRTVTTTTEAGLREGDSRAPYVLVEFTDYYCPYCSTFAISALHLLVSKAPDLEVVVRNYPIRQIHPDAPRLASIVECLADHDPRRAWELHYQLFARQASFNGGGLEGTLSEHLQSAADCREPEGLHPRVEMDLKEVERLRLQGTPALVLGRRIDGDSVTGLLLPGAYPATEILRLLDSLRTVTGLPAGGL